jgi:hypothetical protein
VSEGGNGRVKKIRLRETEKMKDSLRGKKEGGRENDAKWIEICVIVKREA